MVFINNSYLKALGEKGAIPFLFVFKYQLIGIKILRKEKDYLEILRLTASISFISAERGVVYVRSLRETRK